MQDQAAGGGVAPPSVSLPPPMETRARLQTNRHTDTRRSPPFTIGLVGVALLGGGGGEVRCGGRLRSFREFWRLLALASQEQCHGELCCWGLSP